MVIKFDENIKIQLQYIFEKHFVMWNGFKFTVRHVYEKLQTI
jgi:hypothetical protein